MFLGSGIRGVDHCVQLVLVAVAQHPRPQAMGDFSDPVLAPLDVRRGTHPYEGIARKVWRRRADHPEPGRLRGPSGVEGHDGTPEDGTAREQQRPQGLHVIWNRPHRSHQFGAARCPETNPFAWLLGAELVGAATVDPTIRGPAHKPLEGELSRRS